MAPFLYLRPFRGYHVMRDACAEFVYTEDVAVCVLRHSNGGYQRKVWRRHPVWPPLRKSSVNIHKRRYTTEMSDRSAPAGGGHVIRNTCKCRLGCDVHVHQTAAITQWTPEFLQATSLVWPSAIPGTMSASAITDLCKVPAVMWTRPSDVLCGQVLSRMLHTHARTLSCTHTHIHTVTHTSKLTGQHCIHCEGRGEAVSHLPCCAAASLST